MHVGLNYIYPFYLLRAPLSPAVSGRGLVKGLEQAAAGPVIRFVGPGSEASLRQDCSVACSGPSGFGSSPGA